MPEAAATRRARSRILLVEDHQDTRQMYAEFLQNEFEVLTAADGEEALRLIKSSTPDVLVTDLSLPGIDGFELITQVRADPACSAMPIICLSGYGGHAHEQRAHAAGCDRILQKPCMPDQLAEIIGGLIQGAEKRRTHT